MVLIYALAVVLLGTLGLFVRWKARRAEGHLDEKKDLHQETLGVANRPTAQYHEHMANQLAVVDSAKDLKVAQKHHTKWAGRAKSVAGVRASLKSWRGRKFPYVLGVLDTAGLIGAIDFFGLHGEIGQQIVSFVKTLFTTAS